MKSVASAASLVGAAVLGGLAFNTHHSNSAAERDVRIAELRDQVETLGRRLEESISNSNDERGRRGSFSASADDGGGTGRDHRRRRLDAADRAADSGSIRPENGEIKVEVGARDLTATPPSAPAFTYVSDYGALGDATADDTSAIQAAIDAAASTVSNGGTGGTVFLGPGTYLTSAPLIVPGGVKIKGQGYGSSPLAIQFDAGGSVIAYCGTDYAVKVQGHSASLEDVAVYDWRYPEGSYCDNVQAAGGILIDADGRGTESVTMSNVLIYWFMGGTGLTLSAKNNGGMAYGSFKDVRVRHAKVGIEIEAEDGSFVNSNKFHGGAISGGITDMAVYAEGPGACNDNQFHSTVIEPSETSITHVYVTGSKTNVHMYGVRLEGTGMANPSDGSGQPRPLVIIDDSSYGNVMNGMLGHTHVQADFNRNPDVDFLSQKSVGIDPAPVNLFDNSAFFGYDGTTLPGWSTPGSNRVITLLDESEKLYHDHNALHVDKANWGGSFVLSPTSLPRSPGHASCTFGIYARSSVPGSIVATMRYESGSMISSAPHSGSGEWEFIGMSALMDKSSMGPSPKFYIDGDVDITAPTFVYGSTPATPGASLLSAAGGVMSGTLTSGMVTVPAPESGNFWVLPKEGNIFVLDMGGTSRTIQRINHSTADRFKKGTVVTLLFPETGSTVSNGGYIVLKGGSSFTITSPNSSLTLVSSGYGTWTEISRNG